MNRILQVLGCLKLGGTEAYVYNHYAKLIDMGIQSDFIVPGIDNNDYYKSKIEKLGGRIFFINETNILKKIKAIKRIILENGPYIAFHSHSNVGSYIYVAVAYLTKIPTRVCHSHAIIQKKRGFIIKQAIIRFCATKYVACSYQAGISLFGKKFFDKKGVILNNGINVNEHLGTDDFKNIRDEFNIPQGCHVCGNITRSDINKNQSFVLDIFNSFLSYDKTAVLIIGGIDGGELARIKEKAKKMEIFDKVRFIGARSDISSILSIIDYYIFPSISEGFGISLIEAQAAGCFCIASDTVPKTTDIGIGKVKYLSLSKDASQWANTIIEGSKSEKNSIEDIRKALVTRGFDIISCAEYLKNIYEANV